MKINQYENHLKNLRGTFAVENMLVSESGMKNLRRIENGSVHYTDVIAELKQKYYNKRG